MAMEANANILCVVIVRKSWSAIIVLTRSVQYTNRGILIKKNCYVLIA